MPEIFFAEAEQQIRRCFPVMAQLRPNYQEQAFVEQVMAQQASGYTLAALALTESEIVAVAGFRVSENLAWGRFLYIDDFVTDSQQRSNGFGKALLQWLVDYARQEGCQQLHLDSGAQREAAHAFYRREGMDLASYHFRLAL